jgi:hypothetical protein
MVRAGHLFFEIEQGLTPHSIPAPKNVTTNQRWAPALFSCFHAREREAKKNAKAQRKKSAKKSESAERERKKARICSIHVKQLKIGLRKHLQNLTAWDVRVTIHLPFSLSY